MNQMKWITEEEITITEEIEKIIEIEKEQRKEETEIVIVTGTTQTDTEKEVEILEEEKMKKTDLVVMIETPEITGTKKIQIRFETTRDQDAMRNIRIQMESQINNQ